MKRFGFQGKLFFVTVGLLTVLTAGALWAVRQSFGQQLRQEVDTKIRSGMHLLDSVLERSGAQLMDRGKVLAELPSLQEALTKNPRMLEPLLLEVKAVRAANLLWATDPQGRVLASTGEYPPLGENLGADPLIRAALSGQETLGFDLFTGEWWLLLSLPVKGNPAKAKGPPQLLGSITLALLLGETYLERITDLLECQVGFVWGEHQLWSPGWPEGLRKPLLAWIPKSLTRTPQEISALGQGRFLWMARPVTGGYPPIAAGPLAVVGNRVDESVIHRTSRIIGWIALLTMVIGAFLSVWTIRPLVQQLESTQAQLIQAEKLASIGELAAGVAHELNNPLMVIMGNAQLALRAVKKPQTPLDPSLRSEFQELLEALDQESHRAKTIVRNLLDFSRVKPPTEVATDLHTLLEESIKLVEHQASLQSVKVSRQLAQDLPKVKVDPGQIQQVFLNVILNAVQSMPKGGTLTLETAATETHVKAAVKDTGTGIPPEHLSKVFDPFFTTKEVGKGTGLGLSVSYGIIQRHNGTIAVTSAVGQGTTVTIQLPR